VARVRWPMMSASSVIALPGPAATSDRKHPRPQGQVSCMELSAAFSFSVTESP
jgi:hypothetical protein